MLRSARTASAAERPNGLSALGSRLSARRLTPDTRHLTPSFQRAAAAGLLAEEFGRRPHTRAEENGLDASRRKSELRPHTQGERATVCYGVFPSIGRGPKARKKWQGAGGRSRGKNGAKNLVGVRELGVDADCNRHRAHANAGRCAECRAARGFEYGVGGRGLAFRTRRVRATCALRFGRRASLRVAANEEMGVGRWGGCSRQRRISSRRDWGLGKSGGMPGAVTGLLVCPPLRFVALNIAALSPWPTKVTPSWCR